MSDPAFPHLFQPLKIRGRTLKNRIMSTGHDTCLPDHGKVNDAYIAYQERRAAGEPGLRSGRAGLAAGQPCLVNCRRQASGPRCR